MQTGKLSRSMTNTKINSAFNLPGKINQVPACLDEG